MTPVRPPLIAYPLLLVTLLLLFAGSVSCSHNGRLTTVHDNLIVVNAAKAGFIAWDRQHQQAIVEHAVTRDEATSVLSAYRQRREPVVAAFEVVYQSLAIAATQIDDLSLSAALSGVAALVDDVRVLTGGKVDAKPQPPAEGEP